MTREFNLKHNLFRAGLIDNQWVTATPKFRICRKCGADVLVAFRNSRFEAIAVDPIPLSPRGEYEAHHTGRRTFTNWGDGLDVRGAFDILLDPAGSIPDKPVHAEHDCHTAPLDRTDQAVPQVRPRRRRKP